MTVPGTIAAGAEAPAGVSIWRAEIAATVKLAVPIALTQVGQITMTTTNVALVGRLGDKQLAAAALGQIVLFTTFMIGAGLMAAVAPLAAQAYGARAPRMVRRALRVGLLAGLILAVPVIAIQLRGEQLLLAFGQGPEVAALAGTYLLGLAGYVVPAWWFIAFRNFMGAVKRPEPALWITLGAIPINGVLAWALIHGAFGLPRLEMFGAGLATTIVTIGMCVASLWVTIACRPFRKYRVLGHFWRPDWVLFRRLLIVGAPISASLLLEFAMFACSGLFMGWVGTAALAAHQIALQTSGMIFMVPFGISTAAMVRVGHAAGRRDAVASRRAGAAAIGLGVAFMTAMVVLVALTRETIPLFYLGFDGQAASETVRLAAMLLVVGATFFIFDGVQAVAAGALRGLNDTRVPLAFAVFGFWIVGVPTIYLLGFPAGFGAAGIWIGLTLALVIYAALLLWRFHRLTLRGYLPDISAVSERTRR